MNTPLDILKEFVADIDAVYPDKKELAGEWPDLLVTYRKAVDVLNPVDEMGGSPRMKMKQRRDER